MDRPPHQALMPDASEFARTLIHTRQNVSPRRLEAPGPDAQQLHEILAAAAAAPDHGQLRPWRFVVVSAEQRSRLAEAFALALLTRDPAATPVQLDSAREKAHRSPCLVVAIAILAPPADMPDSQRNTPDFAASDEPAAQYHVTLFERLVSFGCAIQNVVLTAHAAGFGVGLTSGQAMESTALRALLSMQAHEHAVCCISMGTVIKRKAGKPRPDVDDYVTVL